MPAAEQDNNFFLKKPVIAAAIIIAGLCWYFANGLSGNYWWLLWLAPVPVIIISCKVTAKASFIISFTAYLIGRLSWFSYLVKVATIVPAVIFTLLLPLIFASLVILTRRTVITAHSWLTVFAFPVFFTSFEFLLIKFSPDGTAASIAYSQSNFLPLIQIASVTGILGITFMVSFIPAAIAIGLYYRKEKNKFRSILSAALIILLAVLLFGITRIGNGVEKNNIKAGLVVLDEKFHNITDHPDAEKEKLLTEYYLQEVPALAAQGAKVIVFPERAININKETAPLITGLLAAAAKENQVYIITGYTNFRNKPERNSALVINVEGNIVVDYNKVHLVTGLESQFTPGSKPGLFTFNGSAAGTAICKDLDYPGYIKAYGKHNVSFLYVPAWDFITDDWLHSRMAFLRAVENGFSEIRSARQGRLTINDCYGRVTAEASSAAGNKTVLLGTVSAERRDTFYTRFGDWFGIVNLIAAGCFIFFGRRKKAALPYFPGHSMYKDR